MPSWLTAETPAWTAIERISALLQFLAVGGLLYSAWSFVRFLRHVRRRRQALDRLAAGATPHPCALAVACGGSIAPAVRRFLATAYPGADIPVVEYAISEELSAATIHRHEGRLRRTKERFQREGVTELHLFIKGPVVLAAVVGALLDNWVAVKLYHNNREGRYEPWTLLHLAKSLPVSRLIEDEAAAVVFGGAGSDGARDPKVLA